jgi:hypothetical protein
MYKLLQIFRGSAAFSVRKIEQIGSAMQDASQIVARKG